MDSYSSPKSTSSSLESTMEDGCRGQYRTLTRKHSQSFDSRFFLVGESGEEERHFLESCFLCQKSISCSREIFMYRGDAAFCSEKCRAEQMEMDESLETVERRQRLRSKSSVSYNRVNSARNGSEEQEQKKSIFLRPTFTNLTACGLISMQNSGYATNTTFMEP